jgi:ankyrin repeat protein
MLVHKGEIKLLKQVVDAHGVDPSTVMYNCPYHDCLHISEIYSDIYSTAAENLLFDAVDPYPFNYCDCDRESCENVHSFNDYPSSATTEFLINNGCDVNARDENGRTGLLIKSGMTE